MKYTPGTIAKALVAFVVAAASTAAASAHGVDISSLSLPEWMLTLGAGLTAGGGVFAVPNKSTEPQQSVADQAITSINATVDQAKQSVSELDRVKDAASSILGEFPVVGPLAQQVLDSFHIPGF